MKEVAEADLSAEFGQLVRGSSGEVRLSMRALLRSLRQYRDQGGPYDGGEWPDIYREQCTQTLNELLNALVFKPEVGSPAVALVSV